MNDAVEQLRGARPRRGARAIYRLQLGPELDLRTAARTVPYLSALGISHLVLSPVLQTVPGSPRGDHVVDPSRIHEELGGEDGLSALIETAHSNGLGVIVEFTPNHVGLRSPANPWWWDTLRHGPDGRFGAHLDIRWTPGPHDQPWMLVPRLRASLEDELDRDAMHLDHAAPSQAPRRDGYRIVYPGAAWPVRPGSIEALGLEEDDVPSVVHGIAADRALLHDLLDLQFYELADVRRANEELNLRRFQDDPTLGAVRVEDPRVFADLHAVVLDRVRDGSFDGLHLLHVEGLRDPVGYLHDLRRAAGPWAWIAVDLVLQPGEARRESWPIDGYTGDGVADLILGLHVDPRAARTFRSLRGETTEVDVVADDDDDLAALISEHRRHALMGRFGTERHWLTDRLQAALPGIDRVLAHDLVVELLIAWPGQRNYIRPDDGVVTPEDRVAIETACTTLHGRRPDLSEILDEIRSLLTLTTRSPEGDDFVWSFQQTTGALFAQGIAGAARDGAEPYVDARVAGTDADAIDGSLERFHADSARRQRSWPHSPIAWAGPLSRYGHDVRARLAVLSQDADRWAATVDRWRERAARYRGTGGPSPAHEHLLFQILVASWPIDEQRLCPYLLAAVRDNGSVTDPTATAPTNDPAYEDDLLGYAFSVLRSHAFVAQIERTVDELREAGWLTSLSMTVLGMTTPGVPVLDHGGELWDLSLAGSDDGRQIHGGTLAARLDELPGTVGEVPNVRALLSRLEEGLPKMWIIRRSLAVRERHPEAFGPDASYDPLHATGERAGNVVAYLRGNTALTIAPRRVRELGRRFADWRWGTTHLEVPSGTWQDAFTGREVSGGAVSLAELLESFPVALLVRPSSEPRDRPPDGRTEKG